ncbi:MAG TPA: glycosyltransferase [Cyclobacteriaceae bacterium]|nr:glycosyltransferase [Cyclobacteriaceae bacterium]
MQAKTILFYTPFNLRSRDTESLMIAFRKQGHRVISLSQQRGDFIHPYLETKGIETRSYVVEESDAFYFLKHILFLIRFCRGKRVDVVYSHLESANFVAAVARYFIRSRVYICRHHINEAALYGFDRSLTYRLTYALSKKIIVVSRRALQYMVTVERVHRERILQINLAYDFSLYAAPDESEVARIRKECGGSLLLITACRLTRYKRPEVSIELLQELRRNHVDARLILLGGGEEEDAIRALIARMNLEDCVMMPGYVKNVPDYLAAADFVVHPSLLESSCVIVKEAGLIQKPVIACNGIGDFDEYIVSGINGFIVNADTFVTQSAAIIKAHMNDHERLERIGKNLNRSVHELFSIENVIHHYDELNRG